MLDLGKTHHLSRAVRPQSLLGLLTVPHSVSLEMELTSERTQRSQRHYVIAFTYGRMGQRGRGLWSSASPCFQASRALMLVTSELSLIL